MPKVVNPLNSQSASGQLGKSIVFGAWKGVNYVRSYVIPANPQSADQGDLRIVIGGLGRAAGEVKAYGDYHQALLDGNFIPSGQTKQSFLVKWMRAHLMPNIGAFEALYTEFESHSHKAAFTASAVSLGLVDFDLPYAGTSDIFTKGLMVYCLAKAGIALGFSGAPYTTAIASWDTAQCAALEADLAA